MISVSEFAEGEYLTMVTRNGVIKKTLLTEFEYQRKGGKIAINLDEDDELIFVRHTKGDQSVMIATRYGMCVRFDENNVRGMGRAARGVRGITLSEGDYVIGVAIVDETKKLLTVTENGMGKRTEFADFREMKHRGGKGVTCHKLTDKSGNLAAIQTVADDDDVMIITDTGVIIRMSVSDINVYSRAAGGVIVMRTSDESRVITLTRLEKIEDIEESSKKINEENKIADEKKETVELNFKNDDEESSDEI